VVAGGGMVGASMVASLGHDPAFRDKKILLLEAAPNAGRPLVVVCKSTALSSRVCAVSPASVRLLQGFGAWDNIVSSKRLVATKYSGFY